MQALSSFCKESYQIHKNQIVKNLKLVGDRPLTKTFPSTEINQQIPIILYEAYSIFQINRPPNFGKGLVTKPLDCGSPI